MESKVPFVACDNPHATPLTVHILAAVAEDEGRRISERTKAPLAAYKARGGKLGASLVGSPLTAESRSRGASASKARSVAEARSVYADLVPTIQRMKSEGLTLAKIADRLNADGHSTRTGKPFSPVQVMRILRKGE